MLRIDRKWRNYITYINAIFIFLIPLVVFIKRIDVDPEYSWMVGNSVLLDFFVYYKAKLLHIGAFVSITGTLYFKLKEGWKFKWDKFTILLSLFAMTIVLSTIFSDYKDIAINGWFDRYEGAISWLSYVLLSYSIYIFVESKEDVLNVLRPFIYATGIAALIGTFQFFKMDFFKSSFGKWMYLGNYYNELSDNLSFNMAEGISYTTLYNPNNVGTMVSMVVPLIFYAFKETKYKLEKITLAAIFVLNIITLIGSKSSAGIVGTAIVTLLVILVFLFKSKSRVLKVSTLIIFASLSIYTFHSGLIDSSLNKISSLANINEVTASPIKMIKIEGSTLEVFTSTEDYIRLEHDNKTFYAYDDKNTLLSSQMNENGILLNSNEHSNLWLIRYQLPKNRIQIRYRENMESRWHIVYYNIIQDGYSILGQQVEGVFTNFPENHMIQNERLFSGRAYIWNRAIPILFEKPLLGHGADTFSILFPHDDVIGKTSVYIDQDSIVEKVHNLYLNTVINFGLIGLLLLLILVLQSSPIVLKEPLIFISIFGNLIAGIAYDSTVYLTYMLFILLGLCLQMNQKLIVK